VNRLFLAIIWRLFPFLERMGLHLLPVHYYSPIPDARELRKKRHSFNVEHPMYGVDVPPGEEQLQFLKKIVAPFEEEYVRSGYGRFGLEVDQMTSFAPLNALTLYAIIRHFKPKRMIEVGSGKSTEVSAAAFIENEHEGGAGEFVAIEPYPSAQLERGYEGLANLIKKKVEEVRVELFLELGENDILFIDSSHAVKIFGDVNFLYLTVLPQLKPGVIVHIHDIFFPHDYLPQHFFGKHKNIWQEQYLLHAFLVFNREYRILLSCSYVHYKYLDELSSLFPWYHAERCPSSFWMRRGAGAIL